MSPFQALLLKDYRTTRKGLAVPIWILAGIYVVCIAAYIFAKIHGGQDVQFNMNFADIPKPFLTNMDFHAMVSFSMQAIMFMSFFGIVVGISMVVISASLLNHDIQHKCELFHRSQPVSVWEITGSRFLVGIVGSLAIAFALGFINMIIVNLISIFSIPLHINWWMSINGLILSFLHISVALLLIGSICFFLSSVFKTNAFGKGMLILGGAEIATQIVNYLFSFHIQSPSASFFKFIMSGFGTLTTQIQMQKYGAFVTAQAKPGDIALFKLPPDFLQVMWSTLFTWQILEKILICVALYVIATYIYQKREIQQ
jgi:ABC-type transport system involved in multi-copper enzyme maturation permease subunit